MTSAKRMTSLFLALVLMMTSFLSTGFSAFAEELRYFERGILTDGEHTAYYIIDKDNKILYLTGDGITNATTPDYPSAEEGPFAGRTDVTRIVIEEDVARVGDYVFANMKSVDTLEVQSNLLSSSSSMSAKAMIGCTSLRHVQGDSNFLSTDIALEVIKGAINAFSGNWLALAKNIINAGKDGFSSDPTLDDETVRAMVDDYINNGEKIFLGDLDKAISDYNDRQENPCYENNAFHHDYFNYVSKEPTCTENGETTYICLVCGDTYTEEIKASGHHYESTVLYEPTCKKKGITEYTCTVCGDARYESIPMLQHNYVYVYNDEDDAYKMVCTLCGDEITSFENDISALVAAVGYGLTFDKEEYTEASYAEMYTAIKPYIGLDNDSTLPYPQFAVDDKTAEILTKISDLVPYLQLRLSYKNGTASASYDGNTASAGVKKLVFGTEVTLSAKPNSGASFVGWYETVTKKYLSFDETYTFVMTSNYDIRAVFKVNDEATLSFVNEGNQLQISYTKTCEEWNEIPSIEAFLPSIPYKFNSADGRWNYDDEAVLTALRSGEDVTVQCVYDTLDYVFPDLPQSVDGKAPALTLHYHHDTVNEAGNFIMAADVPEGCRVEAIGMLYSYKKAETGFNPADVNLLINKRFQTSKFGAVEESGFYILNVAKRFLLYNYAVRGYITYYDEAGVLKAVYTNQVNVVGGEAV